MTEPVEGQDKRTLEQLLDAASTAPTYGLNARELILQAARQIAKVSYEPTEASEALDRANFSLTDRLTDPFASPSKCMS